MERAEQGRASKNIGLGLSDQSRENQVRAYLVNKTEVMILDHIGLDQSKHVIFEQEGLTKNSRSDKSKKSEEENSSLRKSTEG